jgi:SAM-dependent methyltransferase
MTETALLFDRRLLRDVKRRSLANFSDFDFLIRWCENQIIERLGLIKRRYPKILIMGGPVSSGFVDILRNNFGAELIMGLHCIPQNNEMLDFRVAADEDFLPFAPESFDLALGVLNLQRINDLPGALLQIKRALKPDGLFLSGMAGGLSLHELRTCLMEAELELKNGISPRVYPFAAKQDMGALMQRAGFALPVIDSETLHITYADIFRLMRDLRGMGAGNIINARQKTNPGKAFFMRAGEIYAEKFSDPDGRISATAEVIFSLGWAPHDSQQKPLKPGSAKNRLADALNTIENGTGELAGS